MTNISFNLSFNILFLLFPGSAESSQVEERDSTPQPRLQLYLKGPGLPGVRIFFLYVAMSDMILKY